MDLEEDIFLKLSIPTHEVTSSILQEVLISFKKFKGRKEVSAKILDKLWEHILTKIHKFDDQLLCCTCFYTFLTYFENQDVYLNKVLNILNIVAVGLNKDLDFYATTLIYGIFQSSFLTQKDKECNQLMQNILEVTFKLLMEKAYEYSQCTYIAFKTILSFKKVVNTNFEKIIFTKNNQIILLNVINHNWENPITGVRNLNRNIFQTLLTLLDEDIYDTILKEINSFYWNKAKFLMLAEIIEQSQSPIHKLLHNNDWIQGLMYSLHKPGIVSCGSDMYYSILKKINSDEEWCQFFLKEILNIINGESHKAIENFQNYWCLVTIKKFPSLLEKLLPEELTNSSESGILSSLSIMKQSNKLALLTDTLATEKLVEKALVHCNPHIRMKAFDIICVCHGKCLPNMLKYKTVLEFLYHNVNSDCTVLRIHMVKSVDNFLTHINSTFLNSHDIEEMKFFFLNLESLLKVSINIGGNYQRKLTTVKLIDITLKHLNGLPSKKTSKKNSKTLLEKLEEEGVSILSSKNFILKLLSLLKDPADDVKQNVFHVLLNYYIKDLHSRLMFNYMNEDLIKCAESPFFYDIDCGKVIFKLLNCIALKAKNPVLGIRSVTRNFDFWYAELINEVDLHRNEVDSIYEGKQLHSILGLLYIVIDSCLEYKYDLYIEHSKIVKILDILTKISNQFMCEGSTIGYDFSEMFYLVESLIEQSNRDIHNHDKVEISDLHQIVLNCLWLNIKMACDFSALLIIYLRDDIVSNKCLHIIVHVLETCRHKGAIEAAGNALGKSIRHLTCLPPHSFQSSLPFILLKTKLHQLILESKMASVTRRGAGLSIMVHKIISNDMQKRKPLFHYFMNVLMAACEDSDNNYDCNSIKDSSKAIHIHFLARIVTDSSLASEIMYYSPKLAEFAFNNLTSPNWQIRNAALQLYGALIPKLIGQKKASGVDEETISTVAYDEFRKHSINLWNFMQNELEIISGDLLRHSDLVPLLNILANLAQRYNFSYDLNENLMLPNLQVLLGSEIYTVRRLASSCILNIYSFVEVYELLIKYDKISENSLHGAMMLLEGFIKVYKSELSDEKLHKLKENFSPYHDNSSYLSRTIFDKIFLKSMPVPEICYEARLNKYKPGVFVWANNKIRIFIENASWNDVAANLQYIQTFDDFEEHSRHLCQKIEKDNNVPEEVLIEITNKVIATDIVKNCFGVWKFLYKVSQKVNLTHLKDSPILKKFLVDTKSLYVIRYIIPLAAKVLSNTTDNVMISKIIYDLCDPNKDVDIRYIAALANNELGISFLNLTDEAKIHSIKSAIILLQDEHEDIRNAGAIFYQNVKNETFHPYICLSKILSKDFMDSVLDDPKQGVTHLMDLNKYIELVVNKDRKNFNPFSNDSKNIYLEDSVLKQLLHNLTTKYEIQF